MKRGGFTSFLCAFFCNEVSKCQMKRKVSFRGTLVCCRSSCRIRQRGGGALSHQSLGRRGGRSESREKISSARHTPVTRGSSRPVSKLSLLALEATRQAILAPWPVNRYPITSRLQAAYQPEEAIVQFTAYCFWPWEQTDTWCNRSIMAEQDEAFMVLMVCSAHRRSGLRTTRFNRKNVQRRTSSFKKEDLEGEMSEYKSNRNE